MLHEYRKKTTIKAEQFDGSDEMAEWQENTTAKLIQNIISLQVNLDLYYPQKREI